MPLAEALYEHNFVAVPLDWHVVVADVINSTAAVEAGKHHEVNLMAAGGLITALNVASSENIEIPYFFGGDGGMVIVPEKILETVLESLSAHNENSIKNFDLQMYVGSMCVKDIMEAGHSLKIMKNRIGGLDKAVVIGDGLKYAEKTIKESYKRTPASFPMPPLNLEGMECRWDKVKPPQEQSQVICYLIEAMDPFEQIVLYREILLKMDGIFGNMQKRNPLSINRLRLVASFKKLKRELNAKYGSWKPFLVLWEYLGAVAGKIYFKYLKQKRDMTRREDLFKVVNNADTLVVNGMINTIITGNEDKRLKFDKYLSHLKSKNKIAYGSFVSNESVITCHITNQGSKHIHFVDGSNGGYTRAAKILKKTNDITKINMEVDMP